MTARPRCRAGIVAALAGLALGASGCSDASPTPDQVRTMHPTPTAPAPTPVPGVHQVDQPYALDGDKAHRLDLTVPGGHTGPRPVVVLVHGGGWSGGDKNLFEKTDGSDFAALRGKLLEQGWATASVEYRFSDRAQMPAQLHDVKAAVRWVYSHAGRYGLDRDRIAILGESAGGHLAQLVGDTRGDAAAEGTVGVLGGARSNVVAVVSLYGVSVLRRVTPDRIAAGCGPGDSGPASPEGKLIGGDPADPAMRAAADAASPMTHISSSSAPTLFLHGRQDCTVPAAQSERAAAALRAANVPAELTVVDGGHSDRKFYTDPELQKRTVDFLRTYLVEPPLTSATS